jgi:DNA-3-methyladenine glycosylase I
VTADESHPAWVYRNERPRTNEKYFENLARCVFQAGLSWELIAKKWSNFRLAFDVFDVDKVSAYGVDDIARLISDERIIRNRQKIHATIENARRFKALSERYGGFQKWLDGIDKRNNYDLVVKKLVSEFKRVGVVTAHIFLWSVGESIKYDPSVHSRRPRKIV